MQVKHGTITLILILTFVLSAAVGTLPQTISAEYNDVNTTTSNSDLPKLPSGKDVGADGLRKLDLLDRFRHEDNLEFEFVPGEVLVKFRKNISAVLTNDIVTTDIASVDKLNKRFEAKGIEKIFGNIYKLKMPTAADVLSVAREYDADPNVEYAEPNGKIQALLVPNDANYTQQWAHQKIESEYAWNVTTGNASVLVAVVDTGIDYNHSDLDANYAALGYDWINNDTDPMDDHGHGTYCAGIVAAEINNYIGVAGLAQVQIMAEKVLNSEGEGFAEDIASGILHATDQGADIISLSLGGYLPSGIIYDAVKDAYDRDVLLVAAAGNDNISMKLYPAAYDEVVAVTATDEDDEPSFWRREGRTGGTNFGDWVEVAAPGTNIYSTVSEVHDPYFTDNYSYGNGTSAATPHVSGVAALIWSQFPNMTRDQMRYQLRRTAVDLGDPGFDIYYGYGRINASGAVNLPNHDLLVWSWKLPFVSEPSDNMTINTTVLNFGKNTEGNVSVKLLVNGTEKDSKEITALDSFESSTVSCSWTPTAEGKFNVTTYVVPKENETITENNVESAYAWVTSDQTLRVPGNFSTIKEATDATKGEMYYGDATILVASGVYNEYDLRIESTLDSLTLEGEDRTNTIINSTAAPPEYPHTITIFQDNVKVTGFTLKNRFSAYAIWMFGSNNCSISNNTILARGIGVYLMASNNNSVTGNTILNIDFDDGMQIFLEASDHNSISNNIISNTGPTTDGILLDSGSDNNTIIDNTISNFYLGIGIDSLLILFSIPSNNNTIYHNNLVNNTIQAYSHERSNTWDNGYPSGGNYWDDYTDVDQYSGPYQNETGGDGIWDHPYNTSSNDQDKYPLVHPWDSIRNVDTGLIYPAIQVAIDANETLNGHTIQVDAGTYYENVLVDKSLTFIGENQSTTIVDGKGAGITVNIHADNVSVSGFTIRNGTNGIYVYYADYVSISGNTVVNNTNYGIHLRTSHDASVTGNTISNNSRGIRTYYANRAIVTDNTISDNGYGIHIWLGGSNTFYHNSIINNTIRQVYCFSPSNTWDNGYPSGGNYWSDYTDVDIYSGPYQNETGYDSIWDHPYIINGNNKDRYPFVPSPRTWIVDDDGPANFQTIQDAINTANPGDTIYVHNGTYYENVVVNKSLTLLGENVNSTIIDANGTGNVVTMQKDNCNISNFTIQNGANGIYLWQADNNVISDNTVSNNDGKAIYSGYCNNIFVSDNIVSDNDDGIHLWRSKDIYVYSNTVSNNRGFLSGIGISIYNHIPGFYVGNHNINGNIVIDNHYGISISTSRNNIISGNTVSNNTHHGIYLSSSSKYNNITENYVSNNGGDSYYNIYLYASSDNTIYHNNFIKNTKQADASNPNTWNSSYPSGGNYWSDYTGVDEYSGPNQDQPGSDGIGDTPYVIDAQNTDNYPLMEPWP